jgi:hypothetical protein
MENPRPASSVAGDPLAALARELEHGSGALADAVRSVDRRDAAKAHAALRQEVRPAMELLDRIVDDVDARRVGVRRVVYELEAAVCSELGIAVPTTAGRYAAATDPSQLCAAIRADITPSLAEADLYRIAAVVESVVGGETAPGLRGGVDAAFRVHVASPSPVHFFLAFPHDIAPGDDVQAGPTAADARRVGAELERERIFAMTDKEYLDANGDEPRNVVADEYAAAWSGGRVLELVEPTEIAAFTVFHHFADLVPQESVKRWRRAFRHLGAGPDPLDQWLAQQEAARARRRAETANEREAEEARIASRQQHEDEAVSGDLFLLVLDVGDGAQYVGHGSSSADARREARRHLTIERRIDEDAAEAIIGRCNPVRLTGDDAAKYAACVGMGIHDAILASIRAHMQFHPDGPEARRLDEIRALLDCVAMGGYRRGAFLLSREDLVEEFGRSLDRIVRNGGRWQPELPPLRLTADDVTRVA